MTASASAPTTSCARRRAPRAGKYDLAQLPIFSKTLFYVRENYFDKNRLDPKRMLVGALDFVQRDVPEILIDRWPEHDPKQVTVKVNGQQRSFSIERVDAPWSLRTHAAGDLPFVQPNLQPVPDKEESRRLVEIEMAATNGMLYTLDPHSVLLDVETYKDMRTQTQGKFGGLGIVIEMDKKNRITVKRPMPDTPAIRVGIKAKDHIVRINNESTMNMTLNEAVERLRGDVDTNVDVYVERDTAPGVKKFTITRAFIRPPVDRSAGARARGAGRRPGQPAAKVGYFHMQHFSANSAGDLADALALFDREKVKGIIMDLRGNPGGLYEQAQKVSDAFIKSGTLVSMVGVGGAQRKDETATDSGHEPTVPLAVLVNQNSASASEIVAGAHEEPRPRRGHRRGDVRQGLGAGAVRHPVADLVRRQVRRRQAGPQADHGAVPDAGRHLDPGRRASSRTSRPIRCWSRRTASGRGSGCSRRRTSGARPTTSGTSSTRARARREADGDGVRTCSAEAGRRRPRRTTTTTTIPPTIRTTTAEPTRTTNQKTDFLIDFARDFLAQAKTSHGRDLVHGSRRRSSTRCAPPRTRRCRRRWRSWASTGRRARRPARRPQLQLTLQPVDGRREDRRRARWPSCAAWSRTSGTSPAYRVRAVLESDNPIFDENEMVFGKIAPGESKSYELAVKVPTSSFTRTDEIKATLTRQRGGAKAAGADMLVNIEGKPRPMFAYTLPDHRRSEGQQPRRPGPARRAGAHAGDREEHRPGRARCTPRRCCATAPGQEGILISAGRFEAKDLGAGRDARPSRSSTRCGPTSRATTTSWSWRSADTTLGESVTDKIKVKVAPPGPAPEPLTGTATHRRATTPRCARRPADGALVVGRAPKGTDVQGERQAGRVHARRPRRHPVGLRRQRRPQGGRHASTARLKPEWQVTPPLLTVTAPTVVVRRHGAHQGPRVSDDRLVRDVYVRVWNRNAKIPGEEGLLPAEPADRRSHEDGLRGRRPALARAATWSRCSRASRTRCSRCRRWSCSSARAPNLVAQPSGSAVGRPGSRSRRRSAKK